MTADVMFDIPTVLSADEILDKAFKRASKIEHQGITRLETVREINIAKLKSSADTIATTMGKYVKAFPSIGKLNPFYSELIDMAVGTDKLRKSLGAIDWSRGQVSKISKQAVRDISAAERINWIDEIRRSAYGRISSVVKQVSKELDFLASARNTIRKFPAVSPDDPTIVIAGAPNVGKSQLIGRISTAKPRVAVYPFTTQEISVGMFERKYLRYQVIDTPGLLDRPFEQRNAIELRAVLALRHLADAIIFVIDPSETCGYPMSEQEHLLRELEAEFKGVLILPVENKADIVSSGSGRRKISAETGQGVEELVSEIVAALRKMEREGPQTREPSPGKAV